MCEAVQLMAGGSVEIDSAAALGPKAGSGIHFPPNPLVELTDMACGLGLRLIRGAGSRYCAEGMATTSRRWLKSSPPPRPP